jgi:hypothetical protein
MCIQRFISRSVWLVPFLFSSTPLVSIGMADESNRVLIELVDDAVRVTVGGRLFTKYHPDEADRPFFFPVLLDGNLALTRGWPVDPGPDDEADHEHHRGLWYTHGSVNGLDFWTEGKGNRIVQESIDLERGDEGVFRTTSRWEDAEGHVICRDRRTHRFAAVDIGVILDFEIELLAEDSELILGDTKEGSMAIRLAPTLRVKGEVAQGQILNSEGLRDGDTWGKRAAWVDYWGPVDSQTVGVAIFDHPENPRHPTWWHVRTYGLFAANPFGIHDFEKKPEGTGDLRVPAGESVRFRYRLLFHHGDSAAADIPLYFDSYVKESHEEK